MAAFGWLTSSPLPLLFADVEGPASEEKEECLEGACSIVSVVLGATCSILRRFAALLDAVSPDSNQDVGGVMPGDSFDTLLSASVRELDACTSSWVANKA